MNIKSSIILLFCVLAVVAYQKDDDVATLPSEENDFILASLSNGGNLIAFIPEAFKPEQTA